MKTALIVCSLIAMSLPLSGASAAGHAIPVRPEDRALTAYPQIAPAQRMDAVPAWGNGGGSRADDNLSNANGS